MRSRLVACIPLLALGTSCGASKPEVVFGPDPALIQPETTPPPAVAAPAAIAEPTPRELAIEARGTTLRGQLATSDVRDPAGRFAQAFRFRATPGTRMRIHVPQGPNFDPLIRLRAPDGTELSNDDAFPGTLDALLEFTPTSTEPYTLILTTAPPGQVGAYALTIGPSPEVGPALALTGGSQGVLGERGDPAFPGRSFFRFEARGGTFVRLRVTSRDFDTVATVMGPSGEMWVNDDANDLGPDGTERNLDSTIEMSAPSTGTYQLVVSSYGGQGRGAFQVRASTREPVTYTASEPIPAGGFAGTSGQGRVLGLYSGITAYQHASQLYGCADDATFLGLAMRSAHLQRVDEQIVLTDAAATRQAFLDGVRQLAQRAQPSDVVLVFFSGHGNRQPVPAGDRSEIDGLDETIALIDGAITDTELSRELGQVRAGTVILALDSCHSGGFSDDWVNAPGHVGLFSSDADVLSDTAQPRGAGGYLSYYLRMGVLGHADAKPRDGVLQAGELTDYLLEGMVADHRLMNHSPVDPAQRFVMQRGSTRWSDSLWVIPRGPDLGLPPVPDVNLRTR